MKHTTTGICLAGLLSVAVALAAQTPPQTPTYPGSANPAAARPANDEKSVTVTGCLQKGDQPNTYILTNVTGDTATIFGTAAARPGEAGKPATAGTSGSLPMIVTLHAAAGVNLAEHVGHKVEVSGMVVPQNRKKDDEAAAIAPNVTPPAANPANVNPPAAANANPPTATPPAVNPANPTPPAQADARAGDARPENAGDKEVGTSGAKMEHRLNVKTVTHIAPKCS